LYETDPQMERVSGLPVTLKTKLPLKF